MTLLGGSAEGAVAADTSDLGDLGRAGAVAVARGLDGTWLVWSGSGPRQEPGAFRSVFAFLLPHE